MDSGGTKYLKKQTLAVSVSLGVLLILAACAPAATPAPAQKPPAAPTSAPAVAAASAPANPTPRPAPVIVPPTPTPPPQIVQRGIEAERYGGSLGWAWWQPIRNYDFYENPGSTGGQVEIAYSGLLTHGDVGGATLGSDLAESWEMSQDGLTATFKLRKNVKWHDGMPFSAEDVVYSLNQFRNPPPGVDVGFSHFLAPVASITAPAPDTVVFKLKHPYVGLFRALGIGPTRIMPKHILQKEKTMAKRIMGTGPFKYKSDTPGVVLRLEKFKDYFIAGRPYLDEFRVHVIPEPATAFAALQTGQVHIVAPDIANLKLIPQIEKSANLKWYEDKYPQSFRVVLQDKGPFKDFRVRRAVDLAMDRYAANAVTNDGRGRLGGMVPPQSYLARPESYWQTRPGWRKDKAEDLKEAKRLMAEAGFPNGFKTTMWNRSGSYWALLGPYVQADLAGKLGITMDVQIGSGVDWTELVNSPSPRSGDYILTPTGNTMSFDAAEQFVDNVLGVGFAGKYPLVGQKEPKFQEYVEKIRTATTQEKQRQLVQEFEEYLLTDSKQLWGIGLVERVRGWFYRAEVKGWGQPSGFYGMMPYRDVWLEKK
ncbi:MAG: ABC transporter substrate-binding protein [Chloroflexi bacterium]|nr:ABC transporter substrate-binding protein [Chloroflexota bacterium]